MVSKKISAACKTTQLWNHCGPQALAYVLALLTGKRVTQRQVAVVAGGRVKAWTEGLSPEHLIRATKKYGFAAQVRKYRWGQQGRWYRQVRECLRNDGYIVMAIDVFGFCAHWVAVVGITPNGRLIIADPAMINFEDRFSFLASKDFIPYSFNECGEDEDREGEPDQFYGLFVS